MANRSRNYYGTQTITQLPSGVQSSTSMVSLSDKFSTLVDSKGDRKTPTIHEHDGEYIVTMKGYRLRTDKLTGQADEKIEGLMGVTLPFYVNPLASVSNNVFNTALGSCVEQLRGNLDLSVAIAEAGQTARMIRKLDSIVRHVTSFHPKHLLRSRNAFIEWLRKGGKSGNARRAGSMWLEYQYGWRPLAQDLYETGSKLMSDGSFPLRVVGRGGNSYTLQNSLLADNTTTFRVPVNTVRKERCEMKLFFKTDPTALQRLAGYTSLNPASLAWETLPYSFVVDWVYNVGGYLRNRESQLLYNQLFSHGYVVKTSDTESSCDSATGVVTDASYRYLYSLSGGLSRSFWKRRDPVSAMPAPRLPSFEAKLGSGRLLNSAALLSQFLNRK